MPHLKETNIWKTKHLFLSPYLLLGLQHLPIFVLSFPNYSRCLYILLSPFPLLHLSTYPTKAFSPNILLKMFTYVCMYVCIWSIINIENACFQITNDLYLAKYNWYFPFLLLFEVSSAFKTDSYNLFLEIICFLGLPDSIFPPSLFPLFLWPFLLSFHCKHDIIVSRRARRPYFLHIRALYLIKIN